MRKLAVAILLCALALAGCGGKSTSTGSSKGVAVPKLVGMSADRAQASLKSVGLRSSRHLVDSPQATGTVVAQKPTAGGSLARGGTVELSVSRGPKLVAIPEVVGLPLPKAEARLQAVNLFASVRLVRSKKPKGVVVAQAPTQGARVVPRSGVALDVSKG